MNATDSVSQPLAIIGMGCLFPRANGLGAYWARILDRTDTITDVPPTHWRSEDYLHSDPKAPDRIYVARGGFLEAVPFNPGAFGIAPTSLEATDTSQLLGLVVAQQALADAGYGEGRTFDRGRVSVILGVTGTLELVIPLGARLGHPIWRRALREAGVADDVAEDVVSRIADSYVGWQENSFPGLLGNVVAGRIANRLDLGGTNCVVDAACASSLGAIHLAALELASGRSDMVLTGGVDTFNDIFMYTCFSKTPALSPTGNARPFDASADGTILGEGLGMVVLKRLADARRDGDHVYAVVRAIGSSSDGKGNAIYAPRAGGQVEALRKAYEAAGVTPDTIELVEAHGTGTRVGDATELAALTEVYHASGRQGSWCALGSVKSQIGHTKAAAGAAGLIKAALALHHKVLPPTIKVEQPLEGLEPGQSPFYVNSEPRPWLASPAHPRRAGVSAFGFGGSNFHAVLEEADPRPPAIPWDGDVQILALHAATLAELGEQLSALPATAPWPHLRRFAAQSRQTFSSAAACRLLLVLEREGSLERQLASARTLLAQAERSEAPALLRTPDGVFLGRGCPGKLAVLFPGQGAQYPGMLRDLVCRFPAMHDALAAAERLRGDERDRLVDRIYPLAAFTAEQRDANEAALRATEVAQPALGALGLGSWRLLEHFGVVADALAGHSFGELTALCAAGRLHEDDFHRLAAERGRLMAEAQQGNVAGGMLAVQADVETIRGVLSAEGLDLVLANKNAPRQTVLSGPAEHIEHAARAFTSRQIRAQRLSVSGAFHSPLVAAAETAFLASLQACEVLPGRVPVHANTTAAVYPQDADAARALLAGQLARPVEFVAEIEGLHAAGVRTFLEAGPGHRLTGLVESILADRPHTAVALDSSAGRRRGLVDLASCLASLAALGHPLRLAAWHENAPAPEPAVESRKPTLTVSLCGANYVKPKSPRPPRTPAPPAPEVRAVTSRKPELPTESPTPTAKPMTNGHTPPAQPVAAAVDGTALSQALQVTRESLAALQRMQEQTAQLHRQFLEGQDTAQRTVQVLVEQQQRLLQVSLGLPVSEAVRPAPLPAPAPRLPAPEPTPALPVYRNGDHPAPVLSAPPATLPTPEPARVVSPTPPPPPPPAPRSPDTDRVSTILLEVISEKTGYPVEMLELDMALDADLGIDSIKRVEILAALQERLPEAPVIKPEHLGTLHTLRHIVAFLAESNPGQAEGVSPPLAEKQGVDTPRSPGADRVSTILLEVISEKTGYPVEMLELDMALDADLGIDSIKRVEILAALQERLPEAPIIKPEHLGTLHTLRHIVAFLAASPSAPAIASPTPQPNPPPQGGMEKEIASPVRGGTEKPLDRSVLQAVPLSVAPRASVRLPAGAEVWIVGEDAELAAALEGRLHARGFQARHLSWEELTVGEQPALLGGLVVLAAVEQPTDALLRQALLGVQRAGPSLRTAAKQGGAVLATVSRLDGSFGLNGMDPRREPTDGGLAGLVKTAAHEWPEVSCKALDLAGDFASTDEAAATIAEELFLAGPLEVGLSRNGRRTLECLAAPLARGDGQPFAPGDVIVLSGGARGVTAAVAEALARAFQPTLVLLGRSPEPQPEPAWLAPLSAEADIKREIGLRANGSSSLRWVGEQYQQVAAQREIRHTLDRLQAAGAQAVYRSVDVRDAQAVAAVLAEVRRDLGPVRGLVHGAGVLADARLEDKTVEQLDRVYGTKVGGLRSLLAALDPSELRALVLFSSSTGRFGRTGQVDYAIANEVLNKTAQQLSRRLPDCRTVAVNWGPWDGGMVTPGLKKVFAEEGIGLIDLQAGAAYLIDELRTTSERAAEVVILAPSSTTPALLAPAPVATVASTKTPLTPTFERVLDLAEHPVLESHVLDGRPVLPVVLILEWLAHGALHHNPGLLFHGCNDLRVLHGVILDGAAPTLRVLSGKAIKHDGYYVTAAELRGMRGDGREVLHARAEIVLASQLPSAPAPRPMPALKPYAISLKEVYADRLFHGPLLHGLERIEGCGEQGIAAHLRNAPAPAAWLQRPLRQQWITDPLVLDASFQLMVLWCLELHGAPSLPCLLQRYRQYRRSFPAGGVQAVATLTRASGMHALADIDYRDSLGQVVARLEGYECVIDPALRRAFRRSTRVAAALP